VFENRVLSVIYGIKREEETGEGRKLHREGFSDINFSTNFVRVIK
jgi:hypothetical protein